MEKTLIFASAKEVRFKKVLKFIIPTYLTSLFNTVYTMVDGIFVASYVGTNALAAINIVYPIVNVLTGISLLFATGGSALTALHIGAKNIKEANRTFSISLLSSIFIGCLFSLLVFLNLVPILQFLGATSITMADCKIYAIWWLIGTLVVIGKELFTYFIRIDGSPSYSFFTALSGGILNIILDYIFVGQLKMGIRGAALATILGLVLSFLMGIVYFVKKNHQLIFTIHGLSLRTGLRCMVNGTSEFVNQIATAITTIVFNRTAMALSGEDGIAAVTIIMYLQFLIIGVYFGFSAGISPPLGYAYGNKQKDVCNVLEKYAYRFFTFAPFIMYGLTFFFAPVGVSLFAAGKQSVYVMAVSGMRIYGLGFLFSGLNIFAAFRMVTYGKGHLSWIITFLRSFALLLLFLMILPKHYDLLGVWLAVPMAEFFTFFVSLLSLFFIKTTKLLS